MKASTDCGQSLSFSLVSMISIAILLVGWRWNIEWMQVIGFMATVILAWIGLFRMLFIEPWEKDYWL